MGFELEWTDDNIDHIRKQNIEPEEVESVFDHKFYPTKRKSFVDILGRTSGGRILFVVLELTADDKIRVAFARDASKSEKDLYERRAKYRL